MVSTLGDLGATDLGREGDGGQGVGSVVVDVGDERTVDFDRNLAKAR